MNSNDPPIRIDPITHEHPNLRKLARALIQLALEQQARPSDQTATTDNSTPKAEAGQEIGESTDSDALRKANSNSDNGTDGEHESEAA